MFRIHWFHILLVGMVGFSASILVRDAINPHLTAKAQLNNIWYIPAQYVPSAVTNLNAISGAVNIPTTANLDLHVCEFMVMGPSSGTAATLTVSDNQSPAIKYFDFVAPLSPSAGSTTRLIEAKGPEGCVYFKGGIKINASAGSAFYFTMKGYY